MKFANKKIMNTLIALLLMLFVADSLVSFPTVNAAVNNYTTFIYVSTSADVVGVGQQILLVMWTADIPPDIGEQAGQISGGRAAWYNIKMVVTKPDNTTETLTIAKSDPVGGGYIGYTPDVPGTYYVQAFFPEVWKNTTTTQTRYSSGESIKLAFTVQQEQIPLWSETPLPNDYWTRPLSGANRKWYVLTGNWLGGAANVWPTGASGGLTTNYAYGLAPESAHILWTKPYYLGGLMDERFEDIGYQTNHYHGVMWVPTVILAGKVHYQPMYNAHYPGRQYAPEGWAYLDLYTGETLFLDYEAKVPAFGQIYDYESGNQHGGFAYLWRTSRVTLPEIVRIGRSTTARNTTTYPITTGTLWEMIDAFTGNNICYVANVSSSGTAVYGKDGSMLYYNTVNYGTTAVPNYRLTVWNTSRIQDMLAGDTGTNYWMWRPSGGSHTGMPQYNVVHDGSTGWSLNASIPSMIQTSSLLNQTASIRAVREDGYVIVGTAGRNDERGVVNGWMMALSLERGREGTKLWESTFTPPFASQLANVTVSMTGVYPEDGVILFESAKLVKRWGYDMKTGALLWEGEPEIQMNYYGMSDNYYQGMLLTYGSQAATELRAYNITTGEILWTYVPKNVGFESPYGNYPLFIGAIADGKIYTLTGEHSDTHPLYRGPNYRCINASDGTEIWSILGFSKEAQFAMADGLLLTQNNLDNMIYCFGKGPSGTTVTASPEVSLYGSSVMIKGTVTDQSPNGRRNVNDKIDFTLKGTPAVSDEDMSAWMEYLFMQQAKPTNATGVPVSLDTIDPNGNLVHIADVTSDINGNYAIPFTPQVPGEYQIKATFAGSKAYGPSDATTYLVVGEAAATASPYPEIVLPPTEMYIVGVGVALVIAIAIGFAITILTLRKRP